MSKLNLGTADPCYTAQAPRPASQNINIPKAPDCKLPITAPNAPMKEPARIFVIGAGSRGHAYAKAIAKHSHGHGAIVGVAEPLPYKRREFQRLFGIADSLVFSSWSEFVTAGEAVKKKVDGVCVCTLDETHAEVVFPLSTSGDSWGFTTAADRPRSEAIESSYSMREAACLNTGGLPGYASFYHRYTASLIRYRPCIAILTA